VSPLPPIDHLVWGGRSLDEEIERFEAMLGVRASPGGRHAGEGTHNALIRLGPAMYLELIAPDPEQPVPPTSRWFALDTLTTPRLVTWAARATDLERRVAQARRAGIALGDVRRGERLRPDGRSLAWRFTYPDTRTGDGLVPFLIDWGQSPHPAEGAAAGVELTTLRAEHPDPADIGRMLRELDIHLDVASAPAPALVATVAGPRGQVELTSSSASTRADGAIFQDDGSPGG